MNFKPINEITEFLLPFANEIGVEIVEVEAKAGKSPYLTVYIDKDGGVDLDTLEKFHNLVNLPLDEFNPYDNPYTLNVSSPGVDRPLKTEKDFMRKMGKDVEIKLYASKNGLKLFDAKLTGYYGDHITVEYKGKELSLNLSEIAKINEAIKFD